MFGLLDRIRCGALDCCLIIVIVLSFDVTAVSHVDAAGVQPAGQPHDLSLAQVKQRIAEHNAQLASNPTSHTRPFTWEELERIEDYISGHAKSSNQAEWIALVPAIIPFTDAATAEGVPISLAFALLIKPTAVLKVTENNDGLNGVELVCGAPFIEQPAAEERLYRKQAIAAVRTVKDPTLQQIKEKCLRLLQTPAAGSL